MAGGWGPGEAVLRPGGRVLPDPPQGPAQGRGQADEEYEQCSDPQPALEIRGSVLFIVNLAK